MEFVGSMLSCHILLAQMLSVFNRVGGSRRQCPLPVCSHGRPHRTSFVGPRRRADFLEQNDRGALVRYITYLAPIRRYFESLLLVEWVDCLHEPDARVIVRHLSHFLYCEPSRTAPSCSLAQWPHQRILPSALIPKLEWVRLYPSQILRWLRHRGRSTRENTGLSSRRWCLP